MAVKPIPEGYHSVTPYLVNEGVPKLMDFLKKAFGAQEIFRFAMPDGSIMHAEVKIGDSRIMMGEAGGEHKPKPCTIHLYVENSDAVYKRALDAGATVVREIADQFYGDRSGGVKDPAGNIWWISTHKEDVSPEEMQKRQKAVMKQRQGA